MSAEMMSRLRMLGFGVAAAVVAGGATGTWDVRMEDASDLLRPAFQHANSATSEKYLLETMGPGVAVFDYDNDGRLDLFFTNGARLDGGRMDKSDAKYWNRLYRQNPDGSFTDATGKAGVSGSQQGWYGMGVAAADFDNDGFEDLFVTGYGGNILYRNSGDGTFTDVTARAGVGGGGWSSSAAWLDYDNDGKLDLFVARYLDWSFAKNPYCGERLPGRRAYCHPDNFRPVTNILYHNNGDGTFADVSKASGVASHPGMALGVALADYDGDGFTDIYVANDSVQCFLLRNKGDGTFEEVSLAAGAGFNEDGKTFAGMGVDFADFDNDAWPDLVVTDLSNEMYVVYKNNGDGTFTDATVKTGIARATMLYSGWGMRLVDFDNDGWKDMFVAQGHVLDTIELTSPNLKYLQPPLLMRNERGRFAPVNERAGKALSYPWAGRGAAFGDLNNDGYIDVVVGNCGQKAYILRNDGGSRNHWLTLKTIGTRSNRDGIGAVVKITTGSGIQHFTVTSSSSYLSASDRRVHAGLGSESAAKLVEIRWPSGAVQRMENVAADREVVVREPAR